MNTGIQIYNHIVTKVTFFFKQLKLKIKQSTGRPLKINPIETISLALFKQAQGIKTKKSIFEIFQPRCSYKTLAVNMKKAVDLATLILQAILKWNQSNAHPIKFTDGTDIAVCLNKNAKHHQTMSSLADWGYSGKGFYYGLKMVITTDWRRQMLAVRFASGGTDERQVFRTLNRDLYGIFVADAGFLSQDLARDFYREHQRVLFAKPKANMKKLATVFQSYLYRQRVFIELNFRNLKMFYGLETSLPRSIDGYLGNYVYSLLAYVLR